MAYEETYEKLAASVGISLETLLIILAVIAIWDGIWKLLAMWKAAAKKKSVLWFVILAIFNTAGILPILYIYIFSKMDLSKKQSQKSPKKRKGGK